MLGFAAPMLALWASGIGNRPFQLARDEDVAALGLLLPVTSIGCTYAAARLTLLIRPRKLFDARVRSCWLRRCALGLGAGVFAVIATGGSLLLLDRWLPDLALVAGAGGAAGMLAMLPLSRVRPGACLRCGYDLTSPPAPGQPGFGVCPECGADCIATAAGLPTPLAAQACL
jgi:hypothetical protein